MDDIRRPYRGERGNYALPAHRQAPRPHVTDLRPAAPVQRPVHHPQPPHHQTQPAHQTAQHDQHHTHPNPYQATAHQRPAKRRLPRISLNKQVLAAIVLAVVAIFGGYLLLKPDKAKTFTSASLAKRAGFGFYYPSPMPSGYSYVNNINAFQDGQAYYMLGRGNKHIVVREQPATGKSLDLTNLSNPITFEAAGGKAAAGDVTGQPAGLVLTGSTLITLNSTGAVTPADLTAVINSLKLVNR